jgi:hypothetical protein
LVLRYVFPFLFQLLLLMLSGGQKVVATPLTAIIIAAIPTKV